MALLCTSCWREPEYPRQLVEADSAMRWGRYNQADSLIASYQHAAPKREQRAITRYHQLLVLESKFLHGNLSLDDLLLADSLRAFYGGHSLHDKHAKALAILGDIYHANDDYPSALNSLLHAEEEAAKAGELWLQGIICREEGQIYLDQRMFDDMDTYFRRSYDLACKTCDTLRMAYSAIRMGKLHTFLNNIDSIIYFYNTAIAFGKNLEQADSIVPSARFLLADLYLQIEEYDQAKKIMTRDTLNNVNWGYWHYQQNHKDSAIYYFKTLIHRYNYYADSEYLRLLAQLERDKGNNTQALSYALQCIDAEDSIKSHSQVEATRKMANQHQLSQIKRDLDKAKNDGRKLKITAIGLVLAVLGIAYISYRVTVFYKEERERILAREQQLRQEKERQQRNSLAQIEENKKRIKELEKLLWRAQQENDNTAAKQLQLDAAQLQAENQNIEAEYRRKENLMEAFRKSILYQRILINAGKEKFRLQDEEWEQLAKNIDEVYDDFTSRLRALATLSESELRVCYLIKIGVKPTDIATMLNRSGTAISMTRLRLHGKIFHKKGTSKAFDEFIADF